MEITYRRFSAECMEDGRKNVECHELRTPVARLQWEVITGEVVWIGVNESHRGHGIARMLWEAASKHGIIAHSAWRTEDGDAFARAMGGKLPKRMFA